LNQPWVQSELGVPLNWTGNSPQASAAYRDIGDYPRDSWLGKHCSPPCNMPY
jgi:hypothetical protein